MELEYPAASGISEGKVDAPFEPWTDAEGDKGAAPWDEEDEDRELWLAAAGLVAVDELAVVELEAPLGCVAGVDNEDGVDAWLDEAVDAADPVNELLVTLAAELVDTEARLDVAEVAEVVEHCEFEDVTKGRALVPFTMKETSAQSFMLRPFTA